MPSFTLLKPGPPRKFNFYEHSDPYDKPSLAWRFDREEEGDDLVCESAFEFKTAMASMCVASNFRIVKMERQHGHYLDPLRRASFLKRIGRFDFSYHVRRTCPSPS